MILPIISCKLFSYFLTKVSKGAKIKTYVVGTQKNRLKATRQLSEVGSQKRLKCVCTRIVLLS